MNKNKRGKIEFAPGKIRKKPSDITNDVNSVQQQQPPARYRPDSVDNRGSIWNINTPDKII